MIVLDSTSRSLVAVLGGAVATNQPTFVCSYLDHDASSVTEGVSHGQLNSAVEVTLVAAPGSGVRRLIKTVHIHNLDTAPVVLTVSLADGATRRAVISNTVNNGDTVWLDETINTFPPAAGGSGPTAYVASLNSSTGSITITGSGIVSVSTTGARGIVVNASQSVQTQGLMSLNGSSGAITITGSGNATVSTTAASAIVVHVTTSQSVQTQGLVQSVNASSGTITIVGSGINTVSTTAAGAIVIHATTSQSVQTQSTLQVNGSTGSVTLVAGNLMSVSNNASTISVINLLSSSASAANVGSASSAGAAASRYALVDHIHAGVAGLGISGTGTTLGTTGTDVGTVIIAASGNITASRSTGAAGVNTIWMSVPAQSVQTQSTFQLNGSTGSATLVAGNMMSVSNNASTVSVINLFSSSNTATPVSTVTSAGALASRVALADHAHAGVGGAGVSNVGSTAGNTGTQYGTWVLAGSNVTLSGSTGAGGVHTAWVSAGAAGAGFSAGASNLGNTAGSTGTVSQLLVLVGSNNITLSQSSNAGSATLSIIGGAGGAGFSAGVSNIGNTAGTTGTVSNLLVLVGSDNITLSQSADAGSATVSMIGPTPGGGGFTKSIKFIGEDFIGFNSGSSVSSNNTASWFFQPLHMDAPMSASNVWLFYSWNPATATSSNSSGSQVMSYALGLTVWRRSNFGANSRQLTTYHTASFGLSASRSHTSSTNMISMRWVTNSTGGTSSWSTTSNGNNWSSYVTGLKMIAMPFVSSLSQGEWFLAWKQSTTTGATGSTTTLFSISMLQWSLQTGLTFRPWPWAADNNASSNPFHGIGFGRASAVTTTNTMDASVITHSTTQAIMHGVFVNMGIS